MMRPWTPLALCLLIACGGGPRQVATVNGEPVLRAEVTDLRAGSTVEAEAFRQDLFRVIATRALVQALETRWGVEISEEEVQTNLALLEAQIEVQQEVSVDEFLQAQGVTRALLERVALEQAVRQAIDRQLASEEPEPSEAEIQAAYRGGLAGFTTVCARHILVESEAEAEAVLTRLEGGEDFARVADEVSLDTASAGGELGCTVASVFDPFFADAVMTAEVGVLTGPVRSSFGHHVVMVDSRQEQPLEEVRQSLADRLQRQRLEAAFEALVREVLATAEVQVEPRYGTWVGSPVPRIVPPEEAPTE